MDLKNYCMTVRVSNDTRKALQKKARAVNKTVSELLNTFIFAFLDNRLKITPLEGEKELFDVRTED